MNKSINFDPEFSDIALYNIIDNITDYSEINIHNEINLNLFEDLIDKYVKNYKKTQKFQYTKFENETTLKKYYTYNVIMIKDFAIVYDFTDNNKIKADKKNTNNIAIYYNFKTENILNNIMSEIDSCISNNSENNIFYTIGVGAYGFTLEKQEAKQIEINIESNYGSDFVPVYNEIIDDLTTKHEGLILLHGEPGTGKTTIIRHIISVLCNTKKIIYIPSYMIEQIANPEFITFIQTFKKSILILEDAEFALQSRNDEYGAQAVSNLLNITSGLLNDVIKIQVIATFNMDKKNIDSALLRPGRLLNEWKFDKLSLENSIQLAKDLNKTIEITEPMTIAEIYAEKINNKKTKTKKRIGF